MYKKKLINQADKNTNDSAVVVRDFTMSYSGNLLFRSHKPLRLFTATSFGFTLAEVLITLGIIGVVAAMTIPTLMNNIQNQQFETGFKKGLSVLNSAASLLKVENSGSLIGLYADKDSAIDGLCTKMRCLKITHSTDAVSCGHGNDWTRLDGSAPYEDFTATGAAVLGDGMTINIPIWWQNCNGTRYKDKTCSPVILDVNGNKKPNKMGRDMFELFITQDGVIPQGVAGTDMDTVVASSCNPAGTNPYNGASCGARILQEGGMKY